jgi:hypothetical protein
MTATLTRTKRPNRKPVKQAQKRKCPKAPTHIDPKIDWSRRDAFLRLPLEERQRRTQAFIDYFAPAFADYSSDDFRADQRREAERD